MTAGIARLDPRGLTLPDPPLPWPVPLAAVALVAQAEGCRLRAYRCPAGVWTCGWGATEGVQPGEVWTQQQADERLCADLTSFAEQVRAKLTQHAEPNELGALVSLAYNIGVAAFASSSVCRAHNAGDSQAAARAFALWNKATVGGALTVLPGLTRRRAAEAELYLTPEPGAPWQPMPQAVAPEPAMIASPTMQAGTASAALGGLVAVPAVVEQVQQLSGGVASAKGLTEQIRDWLGVDPLLLGAVVLVVIGVVVLKRRLGQRREGRA